MLNNILAAEILRDRLRRDLAERNLIIKKFRGDRVSCFRVHVELDLALGRSLRYSLTTSASKPPAITARSVIDDGYPVPFSILASIPYRAELLAARKHDCILASGVRLKTLLNQGLAGVCPRLARHPT